ncbi:MAG: VPLPA-CTERM sorting domain-containing protein [Chromatiales bacterium]|nr:VPLPA-CTERM sorting domain-containing protein [Chromatiales bacterium]
MNCTRKKNLKSILAVTVLAGLSMSAAEAASVYLTPASVNGFYDSSAAVYPGKNTVSIELWMDFTGEPTIGGGVDLDFQGPISMGVFTPTSYFTNTADPDFTGHGTVNADNDYQIHFGNFAGLSGVNKLGDISVNLLGAGTGNILLSINTVYGYFYGTNFLQQDVDLLPEGGAAITSTVPAPAGVWLLLTGLAGLATRRFAKRG